MNLRNLLLAMVAFPAAIAAQNNVGYTYDASGNRILRQIVMTRQQARHSQPSTANAAYEDMLSEKSIRIHPNPTEGLLAVEIPGWSESDECTLSVYDISGRGVLSVRAESPVTSLDLSGQTDGYYLLHISLNGDITTWKIIKK